jgi:HSP20 family protein
LHTLCHVYIQFSPRRGFPRLRPGFGGYSRKDPAMIETDTLPSERAVCSPRRGGGIRYHLFHYYGLGHPFLATGTGWMPPLDVYETDEEFALEINLAGVEPEQVHLEIRGNTILLSGERGETGVAGVRDYHVIEIERGPFARIVELPVPVDSASARAESRHGMLIVRVRKLKGQQIYGGSSAETMEGLE